MRPNRSRPRCRGRSRAGPDAGPPAGPHHAPSTKIQTLTATAAIQTSERAVARSDT